MEEERSVLVWAAPVGLLLSCLVQAVVIGVAQYVYLKGESFAIAEDFPVWPTALALEVIAFLAGVVGLSGDRSPAVRRASIGWLVGYPVVAVVVFVLLYNIGAPVQA